MMLVLTVMFGIFNLKIIKVVLGYPDEESSELMWTESWKDE